MKLAIGIALALLAAFASAANSVKGHVRQDGTYVPPHYRTAPDSSKHNNWSTQGNTNPYTGKEGTVNPYAPPPPANPYQQPRRY